jgi:hypothetical protein
MSELKLFNLYVIECHFNVVHIAFSSKLMYHERLKHEWLWVRLNLERNGRLLPDVLNPPRIKTMKILR